jgi:hypothetical protein
MRKLLPNPKRETVERAVDFYMKSGRPSAREIANSTTITGETDFGQKQNSLSGDCVTHSYHLQGHLRSKTGIDTKSVVSRFPLGPHTFLTVETSDDGELYVDPTLGQFVTYPDVFVGSRNELNAVFTDPSRDFLCGTRLFATGDRDITDRAEWFDIMYQR